MKITFTFIKLLRALWQLSTENTSVDTATIHLKNEYLENIQAMESQDDTQ